MTPETSASESGPLRAAFIGGLMTTPVSRTDLAGLMVRDCLQARKERESWAPRLVFSSNGQGVALAAADHAFEQAMASADLVHADGMVVVQVGRLFRVPFPERVATTDFFHDAAKAGQEAGLSFFFLGASEAQNKAAVAAVREMYPGLTIAGRRDGYFSEEDTPDICAMIRESGADVLWLALGKPKQEFWAVQWRDHLQGIGWIKTCGGLFAFLSGDAPRAPPWMQRMGLEWLYRGLQEPRRLGVRYLKTNPVALYRLMTRTGPRAQRRRARRD